MSGMNAHVDVVDNLPLPSRPPPALTNRFRISEIPREGWMSWTWSTYGRHFSPNFSCSMRCISVSVSVGLFCMRMIAATDLSVAAAFFIHVLAHPPSRRALTTYPGTRARTQEGRMEAAQILAAAGTSCVLLFLSSRFRGSSHSVLY